jgi:hypothetical protein
MENEALFFLSCSLCDGEHNKSICCAAYLPHTEWTIAIIEHLDPPTFRRILPILQVRCRGCFDVGSLASVS